MQNHHKSRSMKRYLTCAPLLIALSACSSAGSLRDTIPTAVYVGTSSVADVVSCVSTAWATKGADIDTVPFIGGTSLQIQKTDDSPILALVDITAGSGGRTIAKYYSRMTDDDTWFFQQVKSCM
jgi:hypothetical protein